MKRTFIVVGLILVIFLLAKCKHELPAPTEFISNDPPVNSGSCSPDSVYFSNTILPLVSSSCAMAGCHDAISREEDLTLNSYSGIRRIAQPGNVEGSKLYKVITIASGEDVMPPPPHPRLTSENIAAIQQWILQGARNNQCNAQCDTNSYTFSGSVLPMLNTYCTGCHNPASPGGGIDLSIYDNIRLVALDARLLGSLRQASGFSPMPKGGNKLDECELKQIEKWIQSGTPNN